MRPNVYIEVSGLPPEEAPRNTTKNYDFARLARKMIFGTDWPGVPGPKTNAQAVTDLGLEHETLEGVLHKNARHVYKLEEARLGETPEDNSEETGGA